jgi:radical SAM protein with 4Fe4S-binding SPASM domain
MVTVLDDDQTPFEPRLFSSASRTCQVGLASCAISPYGEVYPCLELRTSAGNVRRQKFADIWSTSPVFQDLRTRHTFANLHECQVCPINQYCEARCSGLAWKEHGNPYAGHSLACQHAQARFMQQNPGQMAPRTPLQLRMGVNGAAAKR